MQALKRTLSTLALVLALGTAALAAGPAQALPMKTTKLGRHLCKVVHGGRFVKIPGFPGERIDRRLLPDVHWMKQRFHIFITDAYSTDPVHAANGEHPIGLAADIVPNTAKGGSWHEITQLAHLAEPTQNAPIMPWRWVGYNGDVGHGRGNHLHLSWSHSDTQPRDPARTVYTRICPDGMSDGDGDGGGGKPRRHRNRHDGHGGSGGVDPGDGGSGSGGIDGKRSTGISPRIGPLAPVVVEQY